MLKEGKGRRKEGNGKERNGERKGGRIEKEGGRREGERKEWGDRTTTAGFCNQHSTCFLSYSYTQFILSGKNDCVKPFKTPGP